MRTAAAPMVPQRFDLSSRWPLFLALSPAQLAATITGMPAECLWIVVPCTVALALAHFTLSTSSFLRAVGVGYIAGAIALPFLFFLGVVL